MALKAYYLSPEGDLKRDLNKEEIGLAFESKAGLLWVDVAGIDEEDAQFLERTFHFHYLAVEDCVSRLIHPPKIDDFGDHLFIIVHGVDYTAKSDIVQTTELAIFIGPTFVVSSHNSPLYAIGSVMAMVVEDGRPMRRGAHFLAHALIDALIDNVLPTIDNMGDIAGQIEEEVIRNPQRSTPEALLKLKRSSLRIHRIMAPQREIMNRLSRGEFALARGEAEIFFRDIYDHIVRIEDMNQSLRERGPTMRCPPTCRRWPTVRTRP